MTCAVGRDRDTAEDKPVWLGIWDELKNMGDFQSNTGTTELGIAF